jgi:hypothetical protein
VNLALAIGKQKIMSIDALLDTENTIMYMGVPELTKKYIKMDMGEMMGNAAILDTTDLMAQLMEDMPSDQEMEKLVEFLSDNPQRQQGYMDKLERMERRGVIEEEIVW